MDSVRVSENPRSIETTIIARRERHLKETDAEERRGLLMLIGTINSSSFHFETQGQIIIISGMSARRLLNIPPTAP